MCAPCLKVVLFEFHFLLITMGPASMQVAERISALEAELRRSKRREEKLAALQYRLREDLKQNQGDIR